MAHEDARNGIGKLFTAQVLMIIAVVCSFVGLVCTAVGIRAMGASPFGASMGASVGLVISAIAAMVLIIIGCILNLAGLSRAGRDSERIKGAFLVAIILLVIGIMSGITSTIVGPGYSWVSNIFSIATAILRLCIAYMVLMGCAELNSSLSDMASSTWKMYLCVVIIDIIIVIVTLILGLIGITASSVAILMVMGILDAVVSIVSYIMYLTFLARAKDEV